MSKVCYNKFAKKNNITQEAHMCPMNTIITQPVPERQEERKKYTPSEKFKIGCAALGGASVSELSNTSGISRGYIYRQKDKVIEYANKLDNSEIEVPTLKLDKQTIDRMILSLTLDCQSPNSGIVRFFETVVCEVSVSAGYISGVLAEAARRARAFDDQIDLSKIRQGANDEIFQCGVPILTGIDPESTYAYLLEEVSDRKAETWAIYLDDRKDKGLNLETSINDGGAGLMAGIPQVFPDVELQSDTFHAVYDLGKEVAKLERNAYKMMKREYDLEKNLASKRPRAKNKESLEEIKPKTAEAIRIYDLVFILFTQLKELLSFSGYNLSESKTLAEWILQEMDAIAAANSGLRNEIAKVRKMLPSLLSFIGRLECEMEKVAKEKGLPVEGFRLMYQQLTYDYGSMKSSELIYLQTLVFGKRYDEAKLEFDLILNRIKKASSLVENLNGRIRVFIEVKRVIPIGFFVLLKVYFNTRRYKRSRCKERIGKSPLELLTQTPQPEFLEALGY